GGRRGKKPFYLLSSSASSASSAVKFFLSLERTVHRCACQADGALVIMPQAIRGRMLFQRASEIVAAIDHHPAVVVLDPFQQRRHLTQLRVRAAAVFLFAAAAHLANFHAVQLLTKKLVV